MNPNKPSPQEVSMYLKKWAVSQKNDYVPKEKCLIKLFSNHPQNIQLSIVLRKAKLLNKLYNTRISSSHIELVAERIVDLSIDQRLANLDLTLVNDIANNEKTKRNYSFAAKYCSFHYPEDYPIYDSIVDEVLRHFNQEDNFGYFTKVYLKDYPTFHEVLMTFIKFYGLEKFKLKEIDHYLWLVGKDLKKCKTQGL